MTASINEINQEMIDAIFSLGVNFFVQGKYEKAAIIFDGILALDARHLEASIALGEVLMMEGHYERALDHFLAERVRGRSEPQIVLGIAKAYHLLGRFDEAKKVVEPILGGEISASEAELFFAKLLHEKSIIS